MPPAHRMFPHGPWTCQLLHQAPAKERDGLPDSAGEGLAIDNTHPDKHLRGSGLVAKWEEAVRGSHLISISQRTCWHHSKQNCHGPSENEAWVRWLVWGRTSKTIILPLPPSSNLLAPPTVRKFWSWSQRSLQPKPPSQKGRNLSGRGRWLATSLLLRCCPAGQYPSILVITWVMLITKLPTLRLLFSHELLEPGRFWSVTELFIHRPRLGLPGYNSFKSSSPPSYYLMRNARKAAWFRGNRGFIVFLA